MHRVLGWDWWGPGGRRHRAGSQGHPPVPQSTSWWWRKERLGQEEGCLSATLPGVSAVGLGWNKLFSWTLKCLSECEVGAGSQTSFLAQLGLGGLSYCRNMRDWGFSTLPPGFVPAPLLALCPLVFALEDFYSERFKVFGDREEATGWSCPALAPPPGCFPRC